MTLIVDEQVFTWSRGRRIRIRCADVPGDYDRLLRTVSQRLKRTDDRMRLAAEMSAIFNEPVRISSAEVEGIEEIVFRVG